MDIRAFDQLPLPGRPVVDLAPRVKFLSIWPLHCPALATADALFAPTAGESADRNRPVLELEVHQPGGQALEDPGQVDLHTRIGRPQRQQRVGVP